jgi:hypothetical protein
MNSIDPIDFWKWAFWDFQANTLRGILAEYIVARALDCTKKQREEWKEYDLITHNGDKVEVKCSGYFQSWSEEGQKSQIKFDIGEKKFWDPKTKKYSATASRYADFYVFCIDLSTERDINKPLDVNYWRFLVCKTSFLYQKFRHQETVSLSALENEGLKQITYSELPKKIESLKHLGS